MAYVIAEPCIGVKDTACLVVCPVDCISPQKSEIEFTVARQLYIHPVDCICCGACVPACPSKRDLPGRRSSGRMA